MILPRMIMKNAFRRKVRTSLTIFAMAIAILAFGLLRTVITTWYLGLEISSASRLITRNAVSLIFPLPLSYYDKIRHTLGVREVSYGSWFGGIYISEKNLFASFAVEPKSYLDLYPEIVLSGPQKAEFIRDRRGFIAGRKLAGALRVASRRCGHPERDHLPGKLGFCASGHIQGSRQKHR